MINIQRNYLPGGEWIYLKLYTGPKAADKVLTEYLQPLTQDLLGEGLIDKWFFIRYADPKHHIRFRLRLTSMEYLGEVLHRVHNVISSCVNLGLVWNVLSDTYSRELERYTPETYEAFETYFGLESNMIVSAIDLLEGDEGEELRWLFALKAIDAFLTDFGYSEDKKMMLLEKLKTGFAEEFHTTKQLQKQLDGKYRKHKNIIEKFLSESPDNKEIGPLYILIAKKSHDTSSCINQIRNYLPLDREDSILGSLIHMLMNRLFRSKNRLHEMVLYDMLYRHYKMAWGKRTFIKKAISA